MDPGGGVSALSAARMRSRTAVEQQRVAAQYSGDFFKQILPVMYDASIIDQNRFIAMMRAGDISTMLTTKELLDLAVYWGITPSAAEFWKRHKSREELVKELQQAKDNAELEERLRAANLLSSAQAETSTRAEPTAHRRLSVEHLAQLFPAAKACGGDLFGTKGEYTEGIIYMARRLRVDSTEPSARTNPTPSTSKVITHEDLEEEEEENEPNEDEDIGFDEGAERGEDDGDRASTPGKGGDGAGDAPHTAIPPIQAVEMTPQGSTSSPGKARLPVIDEDAELIDGEEDFKLDEDSASEASETPMPDWQDEAIRKEGKDGKFHRIGSLRFAPTDYDALAQLKGMTDKMKTAALTGSPENEEKTVQRLVARGQSFRDEKSDSLGPSANGPGVISHPVSSRMISVDAQWNGPAADGKLMDVSDFVAKYAEAEEDRVDVRAPRVRTPSNSPQRNSRPATGDKRDEATLPTDECPLPEKLSKLDLYYRPVKQSDRIVMQLPSPRTDNGFAPATLPSPGPRREQNDTFVVPHLHPAGGASTRLGRAGSQSMKSAPPMTMQSPRSPMMNQDVVFIRHRLGGRAGKLARELSGKLRDGITTSDMHFEPPTLSMAPVAEAPVPSPLATADEEFLAFFLQQSLDSSASATKAASQEASSQLVTNLVQGGKHRTESTKSADAVLGRDVQYDGVLKNAAMLKTNSLPTRSNHMSSAKPPQHRSGRSRSPVAV